MNVSVVHTTAVVMHHVLTVMAVTHVHVYLAMKEMDTSAPVSYVYYMISRSPGLPYFNLHMPLLSDIPLFLCVPSGCQSHVLSRRSLI